MDLTFKDLQERLRDPAMTALLVLEIAIIFVASPLRALGLAPPLTVLARSWSSPLSLS
jgi:hypothetical protein